MARRRREAGKEGSTRLSSQSIAPKNFTAAQVWWAPVGHLRTVSGGAVNNSPIPTPRGLTGRGFSACRTRSGTMTVRAQ